MSTTRLQLLTALKFISNLVFIGTHKRGICMLLSNETGCLFRTIAKQWKHYSGDNRYPVPVPESLKDSYKSPREIYWEYGNSWQGEYGRLRKELLTFVIQELEQ